LFTVLVLGVASFPNSFNLTTFDEPSLNTPLLVAFADSDDEIDGVDEEDTDKTIGDHNDDDKKKTKQEKLDEKQTKKEAKLDEKQAKKEAKLDKKQARELEKLAEKEFRLSEKAQLSEERANKIIENLEKRIQDMNERLEKLIDKYQSGEYFGNLKNMDAEIKSFTLSFEGEASKISDSSNIESFTGELFLENQVTGNDAKKFRVTGGELFIGENEVYDVVFGKSRLSSSGHGGDKDSMIVIAQTSNGVDVRTLKLNINLSEVFDSDAESYDIEILSPKSKIASEWFLGGLGTLATTQSMDSDEPTTDEPVVIPSEDIPITTNISVSTPTDFYFLGDEIIISGTVTEIFKDTPVILQTVTATDMINIAQIEIDSDGVFTHTILADGALWVSDTYTVKAFYGANNIAETTFEFFVE